MIASKKTKKKRLSHQFLGDCAEYFFYGERSNIKEARRIIYIELIDRYGLRIVKRHVNVLAQALDNAERLFWYG